ncbi:MAG: hypothetical protein AAFP77_16270 [Bacteroidota bacterium]
MAKRKTPNKSGSNPPKKRTRRKPTKKREPFKMPIWSSILILSIIMAAICWMAKVYIMLGFMNFFCVKPAERDKGVEVVYDAINAYHKATESDYFKDRFLDLVTDRVYWYKAPEKRKSRVRFGSSYDCFCFTSYPRYDESNTDNNNYQFTFQGFYRYRNPTDKLIKQESGAVEVVRAKVKKVDPFNNYEGRKLGFINTLYKRFFVVALGFWVVIFAVFRWIPGATVGTLIETVARKII